MVTYSDIYYNSNKDFIVQKRLEMVRSAQEIGINKTSKMYKCSRNTVKRWLRRYITKGMAGLTDQNKTPKVSPRKISEELEQRIYDIVKEAQAKNKYITSTNVYRELNDKSICYGTVNKYVNKIIKKKERTSRNKRKYRF